MITQQQAQNFDRNTQAGAQPLQHKPAAAFHFVITHSDADAVLFQPERRDAAQVAVLGYN